MKITRVTYQLEITKAEAEKFIDIATRLGLRYLIRDIDNKYREVIISAFYFKKLLEYFNLFGNEEYYEKDN